MPTGAQAVVVNVTAIDHSTTSTFVTAFPAGGTRPLASNINLSGGDYVNINLSGCSFEDVNMSGWQVRKANLSGLRIDGANLAGASIVNGRLDGMTIEGIPVTELLAYWRAGHEAKSV